MKAIKFDLFGKYAFFKNPENNIGTEFSFEHIHKPILLGILGAILGLNGKESVTKLDPYPEYYKALKDIKISIVPNTPIFISNKEAITNTTGFANENSTQILNRKVLENIRLTIYILQEGQHNQILNKLYSFISKHESTYPLYLGNNSYKAQIDNVEIVELNELKNTTDITINSIFSEDIIDEFFDYTESDNKSPYDLQMYAPYDLNELLLYKYKWFKFSNLMVFTKNNICLYQYKNNILYFM